MTQLRGHRYLAICALAALSGCVSINSLVKRTNDATASCLKVGITVADAEQCLSKGDLKFLPIKSEPGFRHYINAAPSFWPIVYSTVKVELRFSDSDQLLSWTIEGGADGI